MDDSFRFQGLRQRLVEEVRQKGIRSEAVLRALGKVPRHIFFESGLVNFAYRDQAFPIAAGQTISQPYTVAFQSELLDIHPGEKVLEIGTGSGYQAAILVELGAKVFSIERQKELYLKAEKVLPQLGYNARLFFGDGYEGLPTYGPFDKILITAGASEIPPKLLLQLKVGGCMVLPLGKGSIQIMTRITREETNYFTKEVFGAFSFVPLLKGTQGNDI